MNRNYKSWQMHTNFAIRTRRVSDACWETHDMHTSELIIQRRGHVLENRWEYGRYIYQEERYSIVAVWGDMLSACFEYIKH